MKNSGYVYVLMNPSMDGLVKIGKTYRNPEIRANELSASTGVPTPFIVVYSTYFSDCDAGEKYVHKLLEEQGYRLLKNREFFKISLKGAIDAVINAKSRYGESDGENNEIDLPSGEKLFDLGEKYFFGEDGEDEDIDKAVMYYEKSLSLGYGEACSQLAEIFYDESKTAIKYLKEGLKHNYIEAYVDLAEMYDKDNDIEMAIQSWREYFEQCSDIKDHIPIVYIKFVFTNNHYYENNVELEHKEILLRFKDSLEKELEDIEEDIELDLEFGLRMLGEKVYSPEFIKSYYKERNRFLKENLF